MINGLQNYLFLPTIALLPSFLWLIFYYKKDKHPEPKGLIFEIFLWGIFLAIPIYLFELLARFFFKPTDSLFKLLQEPISLPAYLFLIFLAGPLIEEAFKLGIVRFNFMKKTAFDEPSDIMIYCVVTGLGFAAIENFIFALRESSFHEALAIIALRFISATLLHATATAIAGYFMALGAKSARSSLAFLGLFVATALHSCYNYLIWQQGTVQNDFFLIFTFLLLFVMALIVSWQFKRLNAQKSLCQLCETKN